MILTRQELLIDQIITMENVDSYAPEKMKLELDAVESEVENESIRN
jgi:hypothetical protein